MIEYKGYVGVFEYDPEEEEFHGRIVNLERDGATFVGRSVEDLKREMAASVDELIAFCEEQGIEPEKPSPFSELDRLQYMAESAKTRLAEYAGGRFREQVRSVAWLHQFGPRHNANASNAALAHSTAQTAQSMQTAASLLSHYGLVTPQPLGASSFDYLHNYRLSLYNIEELGAMRHSILPRVTPYGPEEGLSLANQELQTSEE